MYYLKFVPLLAFIICLCFANFIYFSNREQILNRLFAAMSVILALATFGIYMCIDSSTAYYAFLWKKTSFLFVISSPFYVHIMLTMSGESEQMKKLWVRLVLYLPAAVFSLGLVFTNSFTTIPVQAPWGFAYNSLEKNTIINDVVALYMFLMGFVTIIICVVNLRRTVNTTVRKLSRIILICFIINTVISLTEQTFLQFGYIVPEMVSLQTIILNVAITYGIVRYRMTVLTPSIAAERILSTMTDSLLLIDKNGHIIMHNRAAGICLGYDQGAMHNRSLSQVIAKQDHRFIEELSSVGIQSDLRLRLIRKDGSELPVSLSCSRVSDEWSQDQGYVIIFRDISERIRVEKVLQNYRHDLEELVDRKTGELQDELAVRKKTEHDLKKSLDEKEILLSEVHHRVKNNLAVISSLLKMQSSQSGGAKFRESIRGSLGRIQTMSLIHQKLYENRNFSSINLKHFVLNLAEYLREAYNYSDRDIEFTIDISKKLAVGIDKAVPCGLIINELISNSLKHAFRDGEQAGIKIQVSGTGEGTVKSITYQDNGSGMTDDGKDGKSAGFGTELIDSLASQLDLQVSVNSSSGKGVLYQLKKADKTDNTQADSPTDSGNSSIYLVEDEMIIMLYVKDLLSRHGYTISGSSGSGEAAVKAIQAMSVKPAVVIMDIGLKGKVNGIEAAARLNRNDVMPIIFRTGYGNEKYLNKIKALKLKKICVLDKNSTDEELLKAITDLV